MSQPRAASPAPQIDGFEYRKLLGVGGFADVFLYQQIRPEREVAIKVLLRDRLSAEAQLQFDAEADAMAALSSHPSIVTIYQSGFSRDTRPYLAMQYCSRGNLGNRYREVRHRVPETLTMGIEIAGALETAHRAGLLHRDIKPANILVNQYQRPQLTDFGISVTTQGGRGEVKGMSVPWSPPESFAPEPWADVSSDVWGLAATIYTLLANRAPFEVPGASNSNEVLIDRILRMPLPPIRRQDVPASLEQVLAVAMAKRPEARYASALDFARALQQVQLELNLAMTQPVLDGPDQEADEEEADEPETRMRSVVSINPGITSITSPPTAPLAHGTATTTPLAPPAPILPVTTPQPAMPMAGAVDYTVLRPPVVGQEPQGWSTTGMQDTVMRTGADQATGAGPGPAGPKRSVWPVVAGACAVVALAAAGVVFAISQRPDTPEVAPTVSVQATAQQVVIDTVPSPAGLEGHLAGNGYLFTWSNPEPQSGDKYKWRTITATGATSQFQTATETQVQVTAAPGQGDPPCVEVILVRQSGRYSQDSAKACAQ